VNGDTDRASDVASTVANKTAELAGRARDVTEGLADQAASAVVGAALDKAKRPLTGTPGGAHGFEHSTVDKGRGPMVNNDGAASTAAHREDACAVEAAHDHR
jgi:hypothetical protein